MRKHRDDYYNYWLAYFPGTGKILSGKVVGEWCNKKWISGTQSMCFMCKVQWKDCSQK